MYVRFDVPNGCGVEVFCKDFVVSKGDVLHYMHQGSSV